MVEVIGDINLALKSLGRMLTLNDVIGQKKKCAHFIPKSQLKAQRKAKKELCIKRHNDKIKSKTNESRRRNRRPDKPGKSRMISLFDSNN